MQSFSVRGTVSLVLLFCSVASPGFGAGKAFTLEDAVKLSMENNGELKALRMEKGVREAGKVRASLRPNPVLEVDGATGELTGSPGENRISVGLSQEFLTMGKREKRLQIAGKEIEAFDRQVENSARLLAEEVKTVFYGLLLAEKRVELAERFITLSNQLLDVTRQRLEAGDIPELEMNLATVEVARSEGKKIEAERDLYPARARLLTLMGHPPQETVNFTGSLEGKSVDQKQQELKLLAFGRRPDLKALEAEQAKGDAEINLARAERVPNITAGLAYQRENTVVDVGGLEGKMRDNLVGLRFSIPIPFFDRNQAGLMEARARRSSAENRYAFARLAAEREVEAAYARLMTAEKSVAIYKDKIVPQLEENLSLVQEAYRLGEVGILSVIEEQKKFFEVNDSYLTALYSRQTALVKLETAIGAGLSAETDGGAK